VSAPASSAPASNATASFTPCPECTLAVMLQRDQMLWISLSATAQESLAASRHARTDGPERSTPQAPAHR
jgi:hypothetical protein